MIARETCWKVVTVGTVVEDQNGKLWKVKDFRFDDETVRLVSRDGAEGKIPWPSDDKPVTIWEPSMKDAVDLIKEYFDAEEV